MTRPQKNIALMCAITAALLSLPQPWLTYEQPPSQNDFSVGFGLTIILIGQDPPIWYIVCAAVVANVLQLMAGPRSSKIAQWIAAGVAALSVGWVLLLCASSPFTTLNIGALLGLISIAIPIVCLSLVSSSSIDAE